MLSRSRLTEESIERVIPVPDGRIAGHLPIGHDAMLKAVEFPARVAHLYSSLADVDRDTFTLKDETKVQVKTSDVYSTTMITSC